VCVVIGQSHTSGCRSGDEVDRSVKWWQTSVLPRVALNCQLALILLSHPAVVHLLTLSFPQHTCAHTKSHITFLLKTVEMKVPFI